MMIALKGILHPPGENGNDVPHHGVALIRKKLSQASASPVTFNFATQNYTALNGSDYVGRTLTGLVIPAGQLSRNVQVTVNGDTAVEANEAFFGNITASSVSAFDGQALATPIPLETGLPSADEQVAVIGYPARDSRIPDQELMEQIFGDVFDKKRLAPGLVTRADRQTVRHDCSTLGGNSGSAVVSACAVSMR